VSFDPYAPYGPLVDTTMRIVTWNVWGMHGAWEERQAGIEDVLARVHPDMVCLVESWATAEATQLDRIGDRLGLEHRLFVGDRDQGGWTSGMGIVSRWPMARRGRQTLGGEDGDGSPGYTWSNANPLAAPGLYPDRRFDYVLSSWPRAGGVGHPIHCELLGATATPVQPQLSDHYGVLADLRY
jgi:endonuclease/exonuclease/phosphatase family metal-dependent hydrolase